MKKRYILLVALIAAVLIAVGGVRISCYMSGSLK